MAKDKPKTTKPKGKEKGPYDSWSYQDTQAKYSISAALIKNDTTGSLKPFIKRVNAYIQENGALPTADQLDKWSLEYEWFNKYDSNQQAALKAKYDPLTKLDYENSIKSIKAQVQSTADSIGVPLTATQLDTIAEGAKFNNWTEYEIRDQLAPMLAAAATAGDDLLGQAGDAQAALEKWSAENGLDLSDQALSTYVERMAYNEQSIDDVKDELRRTYLAGTFPAWADKISEGLDPSVLVAPYKQTAARLLEVDDTALGFDDPLIQKAMQGVGPDGKPSVVPMYEYEKQVRSDPRWDKTNNAYATYTKVGNDLARLFGFG